MPGTEPAAYRDRSVPICQGAYRPERLFEGGCTKTGQRTEEISAKRIDQALRTEFDKLLDTYLAGEATVAETRRLRHIIEHYEVLAEDFHDRLRTHLEVTRHVEQEQAAIEAEAQEAGFRDLPPPEHESEPRIFPLVGPQRPRFLACVMPADLKMQPHHWN